MAQQTAPKTYADAQASLRDTTLQLEILQGQGKGTSKRSKLLQATIDGLQKIFPNLDLKTDYSVPEAGEDSPSQTALFEGLAKFAQSIPMLSLGPSGSSSPASTVGPDTVETPAGTFPKTGLWIAGAVVVGALGLLWFLRRHK